MCFSVQGEACCRRRHDGEGDAERSRPDRCHAGQVGNRAVGRRRTRPRFQDQQKSFGHEMRDDAARHDARELGDPPHVGRAVERVEQRVPRGDPDLCAEDVGFLEAEEPFLDQRNEHEAGIADADRLLGRAARDVNIREHLIGEPVVRRYAVAGISWKSPGRIRSSQRFSTRRWENERA